MAIEMKEVLSPSLQEYLNSLLPSKDSLMLEMIAYADEHHIPIVEDTVANLLQMLIGLSGANEVLEIGTAIGYSTIAMAKALPNDGHLTTIELIPQRQEKAIEYLQKAGVADKVTSVLGDAREILQEFQGPYDFIFMDAAKGQYPTFFQYLDTVLKEDGLLVADNVLLNGWVVDLNYPDRRKKTFVHRMRSFLEGFKEQSNYQFSLIPLGDGVAVFRKKGQ